MATRRSDIQIVVLGLSDLRDLNTAMNVHDKRLQALTSSYLAFNAAVSGASGGMKQFITNNQTINNTLNQTDNTLRGATVNITKMGAAASGAGNQFGGLLGTMLKYRAVSAVFEGVQKSIGAVVTAMYDMERQAARVQRVSIPGSTPGIRADIAVEAARTGADVKDIGEAYYQLKTQIKDNAAAFAALQTSMNLVVGTEGDARDTTRAMIQIYNQFGDELGRNVDQAEKMRRAGELLAVMWKDSSAEVGEITQSLKYLGPIAELAKVSLTQVAGVITGLTAEGVRGRMGGTGTAQFLLQLVQHLNPATGMIENKGASAQAFIDANTGALDFLKTIQNIVEVGKRLPVEQQTKYYVAISGSTQAARLLGAVNENALKIITKATEDATKATQGLTNDTDKLRQTMNTTAQEGQRAFGGMFSYIALLVDQSPLRGWLHDMGDYFQHLLEAMRMVQQLQSGQGGYTARALAPGGNVRDAVTVTRDAVQQAINTTVVARNRNRVGGNIEDMTIGSELDIATEGMTAAERAMIRHRYLPGGNASGDLNVDQMRHDLATMNRQLANPSFGVAPASTNAPPSPSSLGLRGLTRQQAENAAIITAAAKKYGVDPLAMIAVANYESGLNATNKNATSTATGLFQILKGTAPGIDRTNPYQNAEFAARAIAQAGGRGLTGVDAIRRIVLGFEKPDPRGRGHVESDKEIAGAIQFYSKHGGTGAKGGYVDEKAAEEAQRAADEAAKKQAELLDKRAKTAQIEYEHLKKQYGDDDIRTAAAARKADALAAAAGDPDTRQRLKYGLDGNIVANREGALSEREQRAKEAEDAADKAKEAADKRRELYAAGGPDAGIIQTSLFPFPKELVEAFQGRPQNVAAVKAAKYAEQEAEARREAWATAQNEDVARLVAGGDAGIRARERGLRPNLVGADARQQAILEGTVADIQSTIKMLTETFQVQTPETANQLKNLQERLADANAALLDFHDTLDQKAYAKRVQSDQDAYQLRDEQINHQHKLKFYKDQDSADRDNLQKLRELAASADENLAAVRGRPDNASRDAEVRAAEKEALLARQNVTDAQIESKLQRYQNVYGNVKETVHGAFMDFFHGKGDIGTVAERVGGSIVDAALDAQIKKFTDPLIQTVTAEILAIQGNTDALTLLNTTMGGGGGASGGSMGTTGVGAAVAAGVSAAFEAGPGGTVDYGYGPVPGGGAHPGTAGTGRPGSSDLQKGATAALAAYSIGATSAQQGVNAGNFLGGVLSGASIGASFGPGGSLIGGIVGGAVDLIGGLFHHKSTPTAQPRDLNPAYYNAPSAFDVAAYNYSAYGKLPRMQDVGFDVKPANTPVVNVFVDGAKVAARMEISRQTTLATVSLTNLAMDRHAPV